MKDIRLGIYEKALPESLTWTEKLSGARNAGFDFLEISVDETDEKLNRLDMCSEDRIALSRYMKEENFYIETMCLSGHRRYPIGSEAFKTREVGMQIMEKAIVFARDLGIRIIQLAGYDVFYEESNSRTQELFAENLDKSVNLAAKYGVVLAFENMDTDFIDTIGKAKYWVDLHDSLYLAIYPDIGNLTATAPNKKDMLNDLLLGKGKIVAAHLKDTRKGQFRNIPYGEGDVDFDSCISILLDMGVRMFTAEFWLDNNADWEERIFLVNRYLRSFFR